MEEICKALSDKLSEPGGRGYSVFYEEELLDCLPENARNRDTLEAALKKLNQGGFIDVRYARGSAFCLSVLRPYEAEKTDPPAPTVQATDRAAPISGKAYVALFFCAFAGGLAGGLCAILGAL